MPKTRFKYDVCMQDIMIIQTLGPGAFWKKYLRAHNWFYVIIVSTVIVLLITNPYHNIVHVTTFLRRNNGCLWVSSSDTLCGKGSRNASRRNRLNFNVWIRCRSSDTFEIAGNHYELAYWWNITIYPMLRADSRFWLVNNREIWSRISRLTSSAWDIKTKERHWWRHNGDSDRRPLSLPLRYDLVILCLYDDLGQINVIAGILKLWKRFRMSQILSEHGINSLPLVCFRGYGNLSTLSIAIPRLAFGRAWYCDATCG